MTNMRVNERIIERRTIWDGERKNPEAYIVKR